MKLVKTAKLNQSCMQAAAAAAVNDDDDGMKAEKKFDALVTKHLRNKEVFGEVAAKPAETVQSIQLRLLHQVRHSGEAADAKHVERQVVFAGTRTEIHLQ